jgi:hypothetical protein
MSRLEPVPVHMLRKPKTSLELLGMSVHASTEDGDAESLEQMYRTISDINRKMQVENSLEESRTVIFYQIQKPTKKIYKNCLPKPSLTFS